MKKKLRLFGIFLISLVIYMFVNKKWGIGIPCFFHEITGFYCPGCGVTRLLFSLLKLDFYQAFRYNQLIFILLILAGIYGIIKLIYKDFELPKWVVTVLLIISIVFGILRNVPGFEYLKPVKSVVSLCLNK